MINLDIDKYGNMRWYQDRYLHRLNNAAVICVDGTKFWYQNNLSHRLNGPSDEYENGTNYWYHRGQYIHCNTQKEFERHIRLLPFK